MAGLANFTVDLTDPLAPTVVVNGEPVEGCSRITLDTNPGAVPTLYLERNIEAGLIIGTGVVVQRPPEVEAPEIIDLLTEFFDRLDPMELEREMLDQFELGSGIETAGQACLAVLKDWVRRGQR